MATSPLRIEFQTIAQGVETETFLAAIRASLEILEELDRELTGGKLRWYVTRLATGSAIVDMSADWMLQHVGASSDDEAFRLQIERDLPSLYVDGLVTLDTTSGAWPAAFSERALLAAERLARLIDDDHVAIEISAPELGKQARITERVIANVKDLAAKRLAEIGTLEGVLVGITLARAPFTFSVREAVHGRLIQCRFTLEQLPEVREALMQRVAVRGRILTTEDGLPLRISATESIALLEVSSEFDVGAFIGLDPHFTDGLSAEEYISGTWDDRVE